MTQKRERRVALVALPILAIGSAAYAFTAANNVPPSKAGIGAGVISGYDVSNIKYNLETTNPANIESVEFDLNGAAGTVKARVISGGTYTDCTGGPTHFTCDFSPNPTVLSANELSVISTQ